MKTNETILIIDDELQIRRLLEITLSARGYKIIHSATEFSLLALLAKNRGRVLTHQYILKEVWGYGYLEQSQYLRVFVAQLRKKIENNPSKPSLLITESGIGYRFGE